MASGNASSLVLQEYLSRQDPRFLEALCNIGDAKLLATFADRWKRDQRAWAREQVLAYLETPLDRVGHQPIVKRLFKQAEQQRDHELLGAFMAGFDRLIRRYRSTRHHYHWETHQSWQTECLITPGLPRPVYVNPKTLQPIRKDAVLPFSNRTRMYLRRRVWRYFRRLGFQHPEQYVAAIAGALQRYRDEDVAKGENILDCWGLVHACFGKHEAIRFSADHANVKRGASLANLSAAPMFAALWKEPNATALLLDLVVGARARLVRVWAIQLLRREHREALANLDPQRCLRMLDHDDEEVQQFGAELLETAQGLEHLPIETWLLMLKTRNLVALETICQLLIKHVRPDRLSLGQIIELACSRTTPVARVGLNLLKSRPVESLADRQAISALAEARCSAVGRELAAWALAHLSAREVYDTELVLPFFDCLTKEVRQGAWEWLTPDSPGYDDSLLFTRLLETPFEDVRLRLIEMLQKRSGLPGARSDDLAAMWCSVLLGIHRGGRHKLKAMGQISQAIRREPAYAEALIPVIAIGIRSVRSAEARPALAALVSAVQAHPELAGAVGRFLPELELSPVEVAR